MVISSIMVAAKLSGVVCGLRGFQDRLDFCPGEPDCGLGCVYHSG